MKIAIIGEGPSALEAAIYFKSIDCFVSIFAENSHHPHFFDLLPGGSSLETTTLGQNELGQALDKSKIGRAHV